MPLRFALERSDVDLCGLGRLAAGTLVGLVASLSLLSQTTGGAHAAGWSDEDACARSAALVTVDPNDLKILTMVTPPQPSTGRITAGQTDGRDYVYVAGDSAMFRYRYDGGHLILDHDWGPVTYRTGAQMPGTAPGILGDYVVIQTNFLPSVEPLTVTAADVRDGSRHFSIYISAAGVLWELRPRATERR